MLNEIGLKNGETPERAKIDEFEYLRVMKEEELQVVLIALLPFIKLEEKPATDKCKYMIGTQAGILMIKTNQIMIRVGGGFATLEDHIRQVGPFECIKIYKLMKGNLERKEEPRSFKDSVAYYLNRLKSPDKIVKQWLANDDDQQIDLFENAIENLKDKQDQAAQKFTSDQRGRRGSLRKPLHDGKSNQASLNTSRQSPRSGPGAGSASGSKGASPRGSPRQSMATAASPRGSVAGAKIGGAASPRPGSPRLGVGTIAKVAALG